MHIDDRHWGLCVAAEDWGVGCEATCVASAAGGALCPRAEQNKKQRLRGASASEERQQRRRGVELLAPPLRAAARRIGRVAVLGRQDDARGVDHARLLADLVKVAQPKVGE